MALDRTLGWIRSYIDLNGCFVVLGEDIAFLVLVHACVGLVVWWRKLHVLAIISIAGLHGMDCGLTVSM